MPSSNFTAILRFVSLGVLLLSCNTNRQSEPISTPDKPSQLTGQQLAASYCAGCHTLPQPNLLDQRSWTRVLRQMGLRLGIGTNDLALYGAIGNPTEIQRVYAAGIFPKQPLLHPEDWKKIVAYYQQRAPETPIPQGAKTAIQMNLPLFRVQKPPQPVEGLTTLLQYDPVGRRIFVGNRRGSLFVLDSRLRQLDSIRVGYPPSVVRGLPDGRFDLLTMGNMDPNDLPAGELARYQVRPGTHQAQHEVLINQLQRPVDMAYADLNGDGKEDIASCQFGNYLGRLSWFEKTDAGYQEHVLEEIPGARKVAVQDLNGDGRPDLAVLFAQGDEQIVFYLNEGDGDFRKQVILRFPPVYGSTYFELVDVDRDGDLDILYSNGDNADYSYSLKRYHGVRLFRNEGNFQFRLAWFYPLNGATKALARDFDQDGDLDIATIAYFADFTRKPAENFVYFENKGNLQFIPRTFADSDSGDWLTLEAADVDQDGDEDILLGSFYLSVTPTPRELTERWRNSKAGVLLLENQTRSKPSSQP